MVTQILTHIQDHPDDPESWGEYAANIGASPEELGQAMILHSRSQSAFARRGGLSASPAKQAASRANGKTGRQTEENPSPSIMTRIRGIPMRGLLSGNLLW